MIEAFKRDHQKEQVDDQKENIITLEEPHKPTPWIEIIKDEESKKNYLQACETPKFLENLIKNEYSNNSQTSRNIIKSSRLAKSSSEFRCLIQNPEYTNSTFRSRNKTTITDYKSYSQREYQNLITSVKIHNRGKSSYGSRKYFKAKHNLSYKPKQIPLIDEEYAMEEDNLKMKCLNSKVPQTVSAKEVFSCTKISPVMQSFYKFQNLVGHSDIKFRKKW